MFFVISQYYQYFYIITTECDGGMFGNHCNKTCGKCLNNEQCHHINGSCLNGCESGYQGINCTEGTDIILNNKHLLLIPNYFKFDRKHANAAIRTEQNH